MLKSFKSIFGSKDRDQQDEDKAVMELADQYGIPLLNERSARAEPPSQCTGIQLWAHQKAMLARCRSIEANPRTGTTVIKSAIRYMDKSLVPSSQQVPIGVMNDLPGSGKTYAILSLIADSKGFNIIVVPQNIFFQWKKAIQTMFPEPTSIKYKCINTYGELTSMYGVMHGMQNKLSDYNIILINDIFAETLATTIHDTKVPVTRLIIDEIDSVQERLHTPIAVKHLWLVSASFKYEKDASVGPYLIKSEDIKHVFCKCDAEFISKGLQLPDPLTEKIICEDNEVKLFTGIVKEDTVRGLHSGDTRALYKELERPYAGGQQTPFELATLYIKDNQDAEEMLEKLDFLIREHTAAGETSSVDEFIQKRAKVRERLTLRKEMEKRLTTFKPSDPAKLKWAVFDSEIRQRILLEKGSKWLIFNDNAPALDEASRRLMAAGIKCTLLDGGNAAGVQKSIDAYKGAGGVEEAQVLLLNSKLEAVGMNLENTSNLLFMHVTRPQFVEQIVGRAQRFGRTGRLQIIGLFNQSEDPNA